MTGAINQSSDISRTPSQVTANSQKGHTKHMDSILMYCSYFTYAENGSKKRSDATKINPDDIVSKINGLEKQNKVTRGSAEQIQSFLASDDQQ